MKVFIAYGFNDRAWWVHDLVVPLVEAFGAQVVTGEHVAGRPIEEAVQDKIRGVDGLIACITPRDLTETSRWVTDELAYALGTADTRDISVLEVREKGVTAQGGIAANRQHLIFDPSDQGASIVGIARVLGEWSRGLTMRVLLLPEDIVQKIIPLMSRHDFRCTYRLSQDGEVTAERPAILLRRPGGLQLTARGIPPSSLISVRVQGDRASYGSAFVDVDALTLTLEEEP